jgi:hypothetical protein
MLLGTSVPRGFGGALDTELFADRMVPSVLCREHAALGNGCESGLILVLPMMLHFVKWLMGMGDNWCCSCQA